MRWLVVTSGILLVGCSVDGRVPTNAQTPIPSPAAIEDFYALTPLVADARRGSPTVPARIASIAAANVSGGKSQTGSGAYTNVPSSGSSRVTGANRSEAVKAETERLTAVLNTRVEIINRNEAIIACNESQTFPMIPGGVPFIWEAIPQIVSDMKGGWTGCRDLRND